MHGSFVFNAHFSNDFARVEVLAEPPQEYRREIAMKLDDGAGDLGGQATDVLRDLEVCYENRCHERCDRYGDVARQIRLYEIGCVMNLTDENTNCVSSMVLHELCFGN
jgi:hypothetical protein